MPRKRPPREVCDCIGCREQLPASPLAGTTIAQQQPPPKCLVLYLPDCYEGSTSRDPSIPSQLPLPHVDAVVEQGCSGLLAVRNEGVGASEPDLLVLKNIFGQIPICRQPKGKGAEDRGGSLRNMDCELISELPEARSLALSAGFTTASPLESCNLQGPADLQTSAKKISDRLGVESLRRHCIGESVQEKPPAEDSWTDLIFVCFESSRAGSSQSCSSRSSSEEKAPGNKSIGQQEGLQMLDGLLKELVSVPGFYETVLLVILLGIKAENASQLPLMPGGLPLVELGVKGYPGVVRPKQSFEVAALDEANLYQRQAIFSIQRLPYVIRRDQLDKLPETLSKDLFPGNGCILAERLLPEIAYKLNAAPKYGA